MPNKLFDTVFELKFSAKQLNKQAQTCLKNEGLEKKKALKAMQQGNKEGAQIYASNAIRQKNDYLKFLKLAAQLDGTVSKLEAQMSMLQTNKQIGVITKQLTKMLGSNELTKAAKVMEDFDGMLDNLELQGNNMSEVMGQQVASSTPQDQVSELLDAIADEAGYQIQEGLPGAPVKLVEKGEEAPELQSRLNALK
eukprot:TRINITY_DN10266_c1_g1_i1.p2 TRINITY_DN10266_c1_g1~~TRINITY_DN10266_c1_g1_i1.p2  ORF type:complete len:229 (+),score=36.93 TRINITY_DN10266_c1_g1_i1:105-689(+)